MDFSWQICTTHLTVLAASRNTFSPTDNLRGKKIKRPLFRGGRKTRERKTSQGLRAPADALTPRQILDDIQQFFKAVKDPRVAGLSPLPPQEPLRCEVVTPPLFLPGHGRGLFPPGCWPLALATGWWLWGMAIGWWPWGMATGTPLRCEVVTPPLSLPGHGKGVPPWPWPQGGGPGGLATGSSSPLLGGSRQRAVHLIRLIRVVVEGVEVVAEADLVALVAAGARGAMKLVLGPDGDIPGHRRHTSPYHHLRRHARQHSTLSWSSEELWPPTPTYLPPAALTPRPHSPPITLTYTGEKNIPSQRRGPRGYIVHRTQVKMGALECVWWGVLEPNVVNGGECGAGVGGEDTGRQEVYYNSIGRCHHQALTHTLLVWPTASLNCLVYTPNTPHTAILPPSTTRTT